MANQMLLQAFLYPNSLLKCDDRVSTIHENSVTFDLGPTHIDMAGQTVQVWGLAILVIFTKSGVSGRVDERERVGGGIALSRFVLM